LGDGTRLVLRANLSTSEITDQACDASGVGICGSPPGEVLRPWSVFWCLEPC
jgi:hypothetical protein